MHNNAALLDISALEKRHEFTLTSEKEIFNEVARLDKKYQDDINYIINIDGALCNIGSSRRLKNILNHACQRLNNKMKSHDSVILTYNLANTLFELAEIETVSKEIRSILDTKKYNESRLLFSKIPMDDNQFIPAKTNIGIILNKHGRVIESIDTYDQILKIQPTFGMALGNKADALMYYARLTPQLSLRLLDICLNLYETALKDQKILKIGGLNAIKYFKKEAQSIKDYLLAERYNFIELTTPYIKSKYLDFCFKKNLYLNFDFGIYYDKQSLQDTLTPCFIEDLRDTSKNSIMSERIHKSFLVFNEIIESYTSSRFLLFTNLHTKTKHYDRLVSYSYTLDYTKNSYNIGILKQVFCSTYNILDKIAHLLFFYFYKEKKEQAKKPDIHFGWLLSPDFYEIIIKQENYQLLALRNLALDFELGYCFYDLRQFRNQITHSFLSTKLDIFGFSPAEMTEASLQKNTERLLHIVKSAIFYTAFALHHQKEKDQAMITTPILFQKDFY